MTATTNSANTRNTPRWTFNKCHMLYIFPVIPAVEELPVIITHRIDTECREITVLRPKNMLLTKLLFII